MIFNRKPLRARVRKPFASRLPLFAGAALALLTLFPAAIPAGEPEPLSAALLTRDLGDPRAPGNAKLVLTLPPSLVERTSVARADDFQVFVYPDDVPDSEGTAGRYRAGGVYLWRSGPRIFLDARNLPLQDKEGPARVRVLYAPGGVPLASGFAEGVSQYGSELADVVLAVDVSRSMRYNDPRRLRVEAARVFMDMALEGGGIGRVALVSFEKSARLDIPMLPLADGRRIVDALANIGADGLTNLDSPLRMGMSELARVNSRRPVIILLTDGKNEGSTYRRTHLQCARAGVRIFAVGLSNEADHELLEEMARTTDGIYFRALSNEDLPDIYARLAAELGKRILLRAETLRRPQGEMNLPIDATVRRIVAMADGGARIALAGPGGSGKDFVSGGGRLGTVHVGRPEPGDWRFSWDRAAPDASVLALFGDTPFFLDMFPPQLRGGRLAVGATLARGAVPLAGGRVWAEPVPGVAPGPIALYDDGRHGDGAANDGVYGAILDVSPRGPDRFDMTVRAAGQAWDKGAFVRQTAGLAIRAPEEPEPAYLPEPGPPSLSLEGEVDFGVLFPGETGSALAHVVLDAPGARDLDFFLSWHDPGGDWPEFSSRVNVRPGGHEFELEMTAPRGAVPGDYSGSFHVSGDDGLSDGGLARVKVGTVAFDPVAGIDLGAVPPGGFASRAVSISYRADKAADLAAATDGPAGLSVAAETGRLAPGRGTIPLEVIVSVPIGHAEGDFRGTLRLAAGPGETAIPLSWRVRAYRAPTSAETAPVGGLPSAPDLPDRSGSPSLRPLVPDAGGDDSWMPAPAVIDPAERSGDPSPWERTNDAFKRTADSRPPAVTDVYVFPTLEPAAAKSKSGDSWWSAWWIYLLAALLLLLLLLLLLAYLLYRLGKSELARLLLVSALANLILLILFISALGIVGNAGTQQPPVMSIILTEYEPIRGIDFTDRERQMLIASGNPADAADSDEPESAGDPSSAASGNPAASGAAASSFAQSARAGGIELERQSELSGQAAPAKAELAVSDRVRPVSYRELAREDDDSGRLRRRERLPDRSETALPAHEPAELLEMPEPPPLAEASAEGDAFSTPGEARMEFEAAAASDRPVWSEGDRVAATLATREGMVLAAAPGMEAVAMESLPALSVSPRGRKRAYDGLSEAYPEPRLNIMDPARDKQERSSRDTREDPLARSGVEELRPEPRSVGSARGARRSGIAIPPGLGQAELDNADTLPRGVSGASVPLRVAAQGGGLQSDHGIPARRGSARPGPSERAPGSAMPGDNPGQPGGSGRPARGGGDRDSLSGGMMAAASGGGNAAGQGKAAAGAGDGDASDNPSGTGGGNRPGMSNGGGRPVSDGGSGGGEGRFDAVTPGSGSGGGGSGASDNPGGRGGLAAAGLGPSRLDGGSERGKPESIPFVPDTADWSNNRRRVARLAAGSASSQVDSDSLLIVVGDFSPAPDPAAERLFAELSGRMGKVKLSVEERLLAPADANLADCLLAIATPAAVEGWQESQLKSVAAYLAGGGSLWLDAETPARAEKAMRRLARALGGEFRALSAGDQLADREKVDGVFVDGKLAAVATALDWRAGWRSGVGDDRAMRFLARSVNFFLSGDADDGIEVEAKAAGGMRVQDGGRDVPEVVNGGRGASGRLWDDFGPGSASSWRMPSWSDPGSISAVSDGQGGRALKMDLVGSGGRGRTAVYKTLFPPENFSAVAEISAEVYYDGSGKASLSMVFTSQDPDGGWIDYESHAIELARGWNSVTFPTWGPVFRRLAAGGGAFDRELGDAERMGRAGFFLYRTDPSTAVLLVRDIRLHE